MKRLLTYNVLVFALFYGIWVLGWHVSEFWMRVIDFGAPWSWLAEVLGVSYVCSYLALREHGSSAVWKSTFGAIVTTLFTVMAVMFSAPFYDPFP